MNHYYIAMKCLERTAHVAPEDVEMRVELMARIIESALANARLGGVSAGLERAAGVTSAASDLLRKANRKSCSAEMDIATMCIRDIAPESVTERP